MREKALLLALTLAMVAGAAHARLIDPKTVKQFCHDNHGTYWPTGGRYNTHTYGCMTDNLLIVCGGVTDEQKDSCFIGRHAPPNYHLPTHPTSGGEKH